MQRLEHAVPSPLVQQVVESHLRRTDPRALGQGFGVAVLLDGLLELAPLLPAQQRRFVDFVASYHRQLSQKRDLVVCWSDPCALGYSALRLWREHKDDSAMAVARAAAQYVRQAPRNGLGVLDHLGSHPVLSRIFPRSIWVDSLYMYGVFSAQWGAGMEDAALFDLALEQPGRFENALLRRPSGLFNHACAAESSRRLPFEPTPWLRGNGWVMTSLVRLLELTPAEHPSRSALVDLLKRTTTALGAWQRPDGLWSTIIDEPQSSPAEASGTALVALGMVAGVRLGALDQSWIEVAGQARIGLLGLVRNDGGHARLRSVSFPTIPAPRWVYRHMPSSAYFSHGVGALAMLEAEMLKLNR